MTESEVTDLICDLFLSDDPEFPIEPNTQILDEGICDSLGLVKIANEIELRVDRLTVDDQDIVRKNFGSVNNIVNFIKSSCS